jgi:hypothetical protein
MSLILRSSMNRQSSHFFDSIKATTEHRAALKELHKVSQEREMQLGMKNEIIESPNE